MRSAPTLFSVTALSALLMLALFSVPSAHAQTTYTVTSTADNGAGSLRQAIQDANADAGADIIEFAIPGTGPHTIALATELPALSEPVTLDGLTQPGADCSTWPATLQIIVNGSALPAGSNGITLAGGSSTVRGLVTQGFLDFFDINTRESLGGGSIRITSDANTITCNYIGTDVTGMMGGSLYENGFGIRIEGGDNNVIGGSTPSTRNLISNNDENGIRLEGGATGTTIRGNYIGTNPTGTASVENGDAGIRIDDAPGTIIGGTDRDSGACNRACNLISGNDDEGILILGDGGDGAVIQGNFIGTDITGTASVFNDTHGIMVDRGTEDGSNDHLIGGLSGVGVCSLACNLISGNDDEGILIDDVSTENVTIQGNFIGTDITGAAALLNRNGIEADGSGHVIGGATPGRGNLISGNEIGIEVDGDGITIEGNLIGVAIDGTSALGNEEYGIRSFGRNNRFGGTASGAGNIIAYNGLIGILLGENIGDIVEEDGNAILGNAIYANGGLGIDVGANGVSGNDTGDGDTGPNNFQNFPVLDAIPSTTGTGTTVVTGTLNSLASTDFRLEFFATETCDTSNFGEGQTFIGTADVTTDGSGDATFNEAFATASVPADWIVTATATRLDGMGSFLETSEFSQCGALTGSPVVTTTAESGPGSLTEAINFTNVSNGSDVIAFDLDVNTDANCDAGTGACTLLGTPPDITGSVTVDGLSQDGAACDTWPPTLKVALQGRLTVDSQNTLVRGIVTPSIFLEGDQNTVTCSFIGTDADGTGTPFGGTYGGAEFRVTGSDNTIGGVTPTDRNLIAAHNGYGLTLSGVGNVVQGNFIGTDVTGTVALSNRLSGIRISPSGGNAVGVNTIGGTTGTTPGGACTGACNLISGNLQHGILLDNFVGTDVTALIQGNHLGTSVSGTMALPNALDGIRIASTGHTIGGLTSGAGNTVAFNGDKGIAVFSGTGNRIVGNTTFSNSDVGIHLQNATANDPGDADSGANNLQNHPEFTSTDYDPGINTVTVMYFVDTDPANATYPLRVEFFLADIDQEEGYVFIGSDDYSIADYTGCGTPPCTVTAVFMPGAPTTGSDYLLATATDASGNTSEFNTAPTQLPVELADFEALVSGETVALRWSTASETNNAGFEVERTDDDTVAAAWERIAFVEGRGTTPEAQRYTFTDTNLPFDAEHVRYRLKQVDYDGTFAFSPTIEVDLAVPTTFSLEPAYPNPFNPVTTIRYALPQAGHARLTVYNLLGQSIALLLDEPQSAGRHEVVWEASNLPSGLYLYRLEAAGYTATRQVVLLK